MKKQKCNVCGKKFFVSTLNVQRMHVSQGYFVPPKYYDVVDCPNCGCQKILAVRLAQDKEQSVKDE